MRTRRQRGKGGPFKGRKRQRGKKRQKGGFKNRVLPGPVGTFPSRRQYKEYVYIR